MLGIASQPTCACAAPRRRGCWLRAAQDGGGVGVPTTTSGDKDVDAFCSAEIAKLDAVFGVSPSFCFFDDRAGDNAYASSAYFFNPAQRDGTVLMGINLATRLVREYGRDRNLPLAAVMGHEWAHILQFKLKKAIEWSVNAELGADFAAGRYLLKSKGLDVLKAGSEELSQFFEKLGNAGFNSFEQHGLPMQRRFALLDGAYLLESYRTLQEVLSEPASESIIPNN